MLKALLGISQVCFIHSTNIYRELMMSQVLSGIQQQTEKKPCSCGETNAQVKSIVCQKVGECYAGEQSRKAG